MIGKTLGQVAFEQGASTVEAIVDGGWDDLTPPNKEFWEGIAGAVVSASREVPTPLSREEIREKIKAKVRDIHLTDLSKLVVPDIYLIVNIQVLQSLAHDLTSVIRTSSTETFSPL